MKYFLITIIFLITIFSCKKNETKSNVGDFNYQKAKNFRTLNVNDSAFYYYNIAKSNFIKNGDSLDVGKALVNMAMIQTKSGDFFGGIESSLEANKYLKKVKDSTTRSTLAANYNNLALSFNFLKNFEKSVEFYFKALEYVDNDEAKYLCLNNLADVSITQQKYKLAEKYLQKAVYSKNPINYSKALNNLARAKYLANKNYNPLPQLHKALEIRTKNNDLEGLNSSYETLSEYFTKKDNDSALHFAKKMLETANSIKIPNDQLIALRKIIELEPKNYLSNFRKYTSINSELQTNRNKAKNQFAVIRFDVEKLKLDKAEKEIEALQSNIGIGALTLTLIGGFFYYRKRKQRMQLESENKLKEQQLKTSKKVHDVVANGIYQVMTKIENQNDFNKEQTLDELEFVYEKSRDISYENTDSHDEKFNEKISHLVASFKNDDINTFTVGNQEETWEKVTKSTQTEIYQIIRELLVNMKKHSEANNVVFKFEKINNLINISYADNGIGISDELIFKNGLSNTVSRIENINGKITFETKTEKGLKVNISFPVS